MRRLGRLTGRSNRKVAVKIAEIPVYNEARVEHQNIAFFQRRIRRRRDHIAVPTLPRTTRKVRHPIGPFIKAKHLEFAEHLRQWHAHPRDLMHACEGTVRHGASACNHRNFGL